MKICLLLLSIWFVCLGNASAQDAQTAAEKEAAYTKTIHTRAEKIVTTLNISDSTKANQVITVIADQYRNLNNIYNDRDEAVKLVKGKSDTKEVTEAELKKIQVNTNEKTSSLHQTFLSKLSSLLSSEQVIKVKDGMTYNVLSVTYSAYVDMIPSLKQEEKDQIMAWLVEAREYAMDAESSEKKHAWFGKYKGRINNYLSRQGYDVTEERKEWEKRKTQKQSTVN
jgi:hypothetical protein